MLDLAPTEARSKPHGVAVAEKIAVLRTAYCFRERAPRVNLSRALALLDRFGCDKPP
jgi:hypothetical protein